MLWYLTPSFPPPVELELRAPDAASAGEVAVRVFAYDDAGERSPAASARVRGGDAVVTTDADGRATVPVSEAPAELWATRSSDGAIPSNHERITGG